MILTVCVNPAVDSLWQLPTLQKGVANRSRQEAYYPGGKGIHTAFALAELGRKVTTLGIWGGQTGKWVREKCRQKSVTTIGPTVDKNSRLCITIQSNSGRDETELLGSGPCVNSETIKDFHATYSQYIGQNNIEAVIISGSAPRGFKDDLYYRLVNKAQKQNVPAFVDASGGLLEQSLPAHPLAIHINHKEGQALSNSKNPADIARWLSSYCDIAAVTAGADGLYLAFEDILFHASYTIKKADIFSTIGAGDCLLAGLAMAWLTSDDPSYWARFATACGSANCVNPKLGMLKAKDVHNIVDLVTIKNLQN